MTPMKATMLTTKPTALSIKTLNTDDRANNLKVLDTSDIVICYPYRYRVYLIKQLVSTWLSSMFSKKKM